jgi:hypothetical protein
MVKPFMRHSLLHSPPIFVVDAAHMKEIPMGNLVEAGDNGMEIKHG